MDSAAPPFSSFLKDDLLRFSYNADLLRPYAAHPFRPAAKLLAFQDPAAETLGKDSFPTLENKLQELSKTVEERLKIQVRCPDMPGLLLKCVHHFEKERKGHC